MRKEAEIRICDNCKEREQQEDMQFGGSPFAGWYHLEVTNFHGLYTDQKTDGPWDFCCQKCLAEFVYDISGVM